MKHGCPACDKPVKLSSRTQSKAAGFFPFCSKRCKLLDLGAWLDAEYKIISDLQSRRPDQASQLPPGGPSDTQ